MELFRKERFIFEKSFDSTDSLNMLKNPFNGAYHLHCFAIGQGNIETELAFIESQEDVSLQLIEFDLVKYAGSLIDEDGLKQIRDIFERLKDLSFHLIVRFLYDTDGHALIHEPNHITIIYEHMKQLKPIISEYHDRIYIMQGLFIGNWGEMNGSKFLGPSYLASLAERMLELTEGKIFLSVRTPSQRRILEKAGINIEKVSLYNDGLLGTDRDLGTYGVLKKEMCDYSEPWHRDDELKYQNQICLKVPNGGEVVGDNSNSELKNTIGHLSMARISYLNLDYDQRTLGKWESIKDVEQWPNLKEYVFAHLGYRFLVTDCQIRKDPLRRKINVTVRIRNKGFAPAYFPLKLVLYCNGIECEKTVEGDHFEDHEELVFDLPLNELDKKNSLSLRAFILDEEISFANRYDFQNGLLLGNIRNNA